MKILNKNGNGTEKYTFNAKGTLYRNFNTKKNKITTFRDVENSELFSIYAKIFINLKK